MKTNKSQLVAVITVLIIILGGFMFYEIYNHTIIETPKKEILLDKDKIYKSYLNNLEKNIKNINDIVKDSEHGDATISNSSIYINNKLESYLGFEYDGEFVKIPLMDNVVKGGMISVGQDEFAKIWLLNKDGKAYHSNSFYLDSLSDSTTFTFSEFSGKYIVDVITTNTWDANLMATVDIDGKISISEQ